MKKHSAIALASLIVLTLTGCNRTPEEPTAIEPATPGTEVATPPTTEATQPQDAPPSQVFTTPDGVVVTQAETQVPGLIPSTNANLRIKAVGSGRQDPFSGPSVVLVRPVPPEPDAVSATGFNVPLGNASSTGGQRFPGGVGSNPGRASGNQTRSVGANAGGSSSSVSRSGGAAGSSGSTSSGGQPVAGTAGGAKTTSTGSSSRGSGASASGPIAKAPDLPDLSPRDPVPDPALARAVEVTGVIQIGSRYQAIVKAPEEPTSRYVMAGQRLSNGRVLVKRIEMNGSEPVVILEESGVEVVRAIGAPAEGSAANETAAALPQLTPRS